MTSPFDHAYTVPPTLPGIADVLSVIAVRELGHVLLDHHGDLRPVELALRELLLGSVVEQAKESVVPASASADLPMAREARRS